MISLGSLSLKTNKSFFKYFSDYKSIKNIEKTNQKISETKSKFETNLRPNRLQSPQQYCIECVKYGINS